MEIFPPRGGGDFVQIQQMVLEARGFETLNPCGLATAKYQQMTDVDALFQSILLLITIETMNDNNIPQPVLACECLI